MYKIGIIGTGNVAQTLVSNMIASEMPVSFKLLHYVSDQGQDNQYANVDLVNSIAHTSSFTNKVQVVEWNDLSDCDILLFTARTNSMDGEKVDRMAFLKSNGLIALDIAKKLKQINYKNLILVVSNPVEPIAGVIRYYLNYDPYKIIGASTFLDSQRLQQHIANCSQFNFRDIPAYFLGEHSLNAVAFVSKINSILPVLSSTQKNEIKNCVDKALSDPTRIISARNFTCHGVANSVKQILKAIMADDDRVVLLSTYLKHNEYNIKKPIYFSTFVQINRNGVKRVLTANVSDSEQKAIDKLAISMQHTWETTKKVLKIDEL